MIQSNLITRNASRVHNQVSIRLPHKIISLSMATPYVAYYSTMHDIQANLLSLRHLHISQQHRMATSSRIKSMTFKNIFLFSSSPVPEQSPNYNQFLTIRQMSNLTIPNNKFHPSAPNSHFLFPQYSTINLEMEKKLQKVEAILHSPQKDLYKIVEETIIVLEAFAHTNLRQLLEENVVKVVKEFGKKLVSAYLQTLQAQQFQQLEIKNFNRKYEPSQQTDSNYSLHDNYSAPPLEPAEKEFLPIKTPAPVDLNFILFYIETIKSWLLTKLQNDDIMREAQAQLFGIFSVREVSALKDSLKGAVENLVKNYLEQPSAKNREMFPFELKLRSLCLLPFFQDKKHIHQYFKRLADENLGIYLKQSQIVTLIYDVSELQPVLSECTEFIYQLQSTRIYQNLSSINHAYIKALFIEYSRKFMVSFQQIQFYELFREMEPRIRYPSIRTFIRLTKILNVEAADLHCQYNKTMNKYNYNIIISIVMSQNYNIDNTRFGQIFELFEQLNAYEKCGEVMYDEMAKFLKAYVSKQASGLKKQQIQRIYKLFLHVLRQSKPIFKYEDRQALNREYSRKSTQLLNVLFDILLESHPQVVVQGCKFIRSYILSDEGNILTMSSVPFDDRDVRVDVSAVMVKEKMEKVRMAFSKFIQEVKQLSTRKLTQLLESMNLFFQISIQWAKPNDPNEYRSNQQPVNQHHKLLGFMYPCLPECSFEVSLFKQTIEPIFKQYLDLATRDMIKKLPKQNFRQLYRNLNLSLAALNSLECKSDIAELVEGYIEQLRGKVLYEMKFAMDLVDNEAELKRTTGIEKLQISTPKGNVQLLLTLYGLIKLTYKLQAFRNLNNTQQHLSSTSSSQPPALHTIIVSLPLIYNFINKIAIKHLKGIEEPDIISMLTFLKTLEEIKTSQNQNVLLLEINTLVWEYLYQSMSMYFMYMSDKGKMYLKMTNSNAQQFIHVINHFVANKARFLALPSKRRLVPLQSILVGLVRRKYIKLTASHMKRSESAKIFLAFLQIFQYPQNLTVDMKKFIEDIEFMPAELEQVSSDILERFSDINWAIARYLEDSNSNLTTLKKLKKLSAQDLRKEFDDSRKSKIYEMILKSSKYSLPFTLPEPKKQEKNAKILYILECVYQKISKKNYYGVSRQKKTSQSPIEEVKSTKRNGKKSLETRKLQQIDDMSPEDAQILSDSSMVQRKQENAQYPGELSPNQQYFHEINLSNEKNYIKAEQLVNYAYEDHYKLSNNKLPIHFKKENWKNIFSVPKQLEIESLDIDEKIDDTIYKQVLLATLGYVEKVKLIAKEFHAHSFLQYTAAQLDMEVFYHGCIARISRKNKPQENVLLVCAVQTNYKLLYICTHILRQSGENAYIVMDKTQQNDFKEFLERLLPQPFEAEESEIVDKVLKDEIAALD